MSAILGGLFNSRLNMKLREEKGYTYGAGAGLRPAPGRGPVRGARGGQHRGDRRRDARHAGRAQPHARAAGRGVRARPPRATSWSASSRSGSRRAGAVVGAVSGPGRPRPAARRADRLSRPDRGGRRRRPWQRLRGRISTSTRPRSCSSATSMPLARSSRRPVSDRSSSSATRSSSRHRRRTGGGARPGRPRGRGGTDRRRRGARAAGRPRGAVGRRALSRTIVGRGAYAGPVIVVIGSPVGWLRDEEIVPTGTPARAALAAAAAGCQVQLVGRTGDDPTADGLLLSLARGGVGHVALLRDPARANPAGSRTGERTTAVRRSPTTNQPSPSAEPPLSPRSTPATSTSAFATSRTTRWSSWPSRPVRRSSGWSRTR